MGIMSRHVWVSVAGGLITTGFVWWWLSRPKASPMVVTSGLELSPSTEENLDRIASALEHIAGASYVSFDSNKPEFDIDMGPGVGPVREDPKKEKKGEPSLGSSTTSQPSKPVETEDGSSLIPATESSFAASPLKRSTKIEIDPRSIRQKLVAAREAPLEGSFATESSAPSSPIEDKTEPALTPSESYSAPAQPRKPTLVRASSEVERQAPAVKQVPRARFK